SLRKSGRRPAYMVFNMETTIPLAVRLKDARAKLQLTQAQAARRWRVKVVCVKFSKKEVGKSWGKGEAYSQTPEGRLRQPEPRRGRAPALALSQSNRFVNKPSSFTLGGRQQLELYALFPQHFHVEVTVGFD